MSIYTSLSERKSSNKSTDDNTQTDYTQIASYPEKKHEGNQEELPIPLSKRNTSLKSRIATWWSNLVGS